MEARSDSLPSKDDQLASAQCRLRRHSDSGHEPHVLKVTIHRVASARVHPHRKESG